MLAGAYIGVAVGAGVSIADPVLAVIVFGIAICGALATSWVWPFYLSSPEQQSRTA